MANSRGPETLADLAPETGATAATAKDAAHGQDLVVVTIPQVKVPELPQNLFDGVGAEVVVVDTGNYYPQQRDGLIEDIENGMPESRWVEKHLGRPVVKAFNNIYVQSLGEKGAAGRHARAHRAARSRVTTSRQATVLALIDELGFDAVDNGGLDDSWRHQPGTPVYTADSTSSSCAARLAEATPGAQAGVEGHRRTARATSPTLAEPCRVRRLGRSSGRCRVPGKGSGSTTCSAGSSSDSVRTGPGPGRPGLEPHGDPADARSPAPSRGRTRRARRPRPGRSRPARAGSTVSHLVLTRRRRRCRRFVAGERQLVLHGVARCRRRRPRAGGSRS